MDAIAAETICREAPRTAAQRVHDMPELRDCILANADASTFQALSHATPGFFATAHTPTAWAKQYAPAVIDMPSRTIQTPFIPQTSGSLRDLFGRDLFGPRGVTQTNRELGTYREEVWMLKSGLENTIIRSKKVIEILDKVTDMKLSGILGSNARDTWGYVRCIKQKRRATYALMRDRAYRIRHGIRVPFDERRISDIAVAGVCVGLTCGSILVSAHLTSVPGNTAKVSAAAMLLLSSLLGMTALLIIATIPSRDIFMGPIDHQRLNLWAKQIVRLEEAAEHEALNQSAQAA